MRARISFGLIWFMMIAATAPAQNNQREAPVLSTWRCLKPPIEPCFMHRGRLSSQNGIAYMVWLIGTKRILAVYDTEMPDIVQKYLEITSPNHSYIYGDYEVCPLEPDRPGHMRSSCISSAKSLVVQNIGRTQSPFRLLSTWADATNK